MQSSTVNDKAKIIVEQQRSAKHRPYAFIAILTVSLFVSFFGLGVLGLLGPDEPRYAEVAREMFASGDYISTRLCGCTWFEKPPLLYWMSASAYHLFGVSELAARFPSAAGALIIVSLVYGTLWRLGLSGLAVTASLVLATSGLFIAYSRVAAPDMILTVSTTAALLAAWIATLKARRARSAWWIVSFFCMGLAVLAKGLVGVVLVVSIIGVYLFLSGQLRSIRVRDCLIGLVAFFAVVAIWYLPVTLRHGQSFIDEFFIRHHFQRYTSNEFGHPQPVYFFLIVALAGSAPWTGFLIPAVTRLRSLKSSGDLRASLLELSWVWVVVPLVFFSFSGSQLPGYILPIFPALAVIIGAEVERIWKGERSPAITAALWITALLLVGAGVSFIVYAQRESVDVGGWRAFLLGLPLLIALLSAVAVASKRDRAFTVGAAGVVMSLVLGAVILLFPKLSNEVSLKALSLEAGTALRPGEKIAFYLRKEFAAVFYAEGRVLCEPNRGPINALREDMLADALASERSLVVITGSNWLEGLESDPRFNTVFIARQGDALVLRVSLKGDGD